MTTARISLDSPVFSGRLRTFDRRSTYERRPVLATRRSVISDVRAVKQPAPQAQPTLTKVRRVRTGHESAVHRTSKSLVLRRQTVQSPTVKKSKISKWGGSLQKRGLLGLAILLFVIGIGVAVDGLLTNRHVEAQVQQMQTGSDNNSEASMAGDVPNEGDKPDVGAYRTAAELPQVIIIQKLDVNARVLKMGVTKQGAMAAPANIHDTGWYDGSSKPGEPGAMLIDGHVHGPTKPGVFAKLKTLVPGDELTVERGDGKVFRYRVVKSKSYPSDSPDMMGAALTPVTPGKPGLNLITCTGELDKTTNHYKDRLVVFAEQL